MRQHFPAEIKFYPCITVQGIIKLIKIKSMKKFNELSGFEKIPRIKKIIRIMKLTGFLIAVSIFSALAGSSYSQTKLLNLDMEKATVKEVLSKIEDQSEFYFMYSGKIIDVDREVSVNNKNQKIDQVLKSLFEGTNVKYVIKDRFIVLTDSKSSGDVFDVMQQKSVSGIVTDESRVPLPGVTVVVKGTTTGTITDADGNYSFSDIPGDATLVFSFVGMKTQEILVAGKSTINVTMTEISIGLEEVIAVGYGSMRKEDVTGAVSSINLEDANIAQNTTVLQAIQGRLPGINVGAVQRAGQSPSISIRGQNSLSASNSPLIVVDGIIYSGELTDFSANDIKTIDFLKDASAAAVYGSRSANGVVLISTKSGKLNNGKPRITFNSYGGIQQAGNLLDLKNGPEYIQKILDYRTAAGLEANPANIENYLNELEIENYQNGNEIDWYDQLFRTATMANYELGISGATDKTKYYFSGTFTDQEGLAKNDDFQRMTLRARFSNDITDWLNVGLNMAFTNKDYSGQPVSTGNAVLLSPYSTIFQKDNPTEYELFPQTDQLMANPFLSSLRDHKDIQQTLFGVFNVKIDLPIDGLTYRFDYSRTLTNSRSAEFDNVTNGGRNLNGSARKSYAVQNSWLMNNTLDYSNTFNDVHRVGATVVYTRDLSRSDGSNLYATNFAIPILGYNAVELGENQTVNSSANDNSSEGFMSRLTYAYDNKYLFTGTYRRDGFSGFAANNKYADFYSGSLGWVISQERFFNVDWVDFLKLRLSYGENGNQGLGSYSSLARVGTNFYTFGDRSAVTLATNTIPNSNLKWETTKSFNFALDFNLINNRLNGVIDVYKSKTNDLLVQRSLAGFTGFEDVWTNLGEIQNKGIEVSINSVNIQAGDFVWESGITFSMNRNKIISLYGEDVDGDGIEDDDIDAGWFIGESTGAIYGYKPGDIYQSDNTNIPTGFQPGDFEIIDTDGEEGITPEDRIVYGNTDPNYRWGLSNTFTYKNLSLFVFINSIQGGDNYYLGDNNTLNPNTFFPDRINMVDIPYWTPDNQSNTYPRINYDPTFDHRFDQDRSFVRLQDITLAYDLSKLATIQKFGLTNLRVYASGKNLATWTKWQGYDPELGSTLNGLPIARSYILGLQLEF